MHIVSGLANSAVTLALFVFGAPNACAGVVYDLIFDQSSYSVVPNGAVVVQLILRENATLPDTNRITDTVGVTSGGVQVNWDSGLIGSRVNAVGDAANGTGLTDAGKTLTAATGVEMLQLSIAGVFGTQITGPPGVREVNLGNLTVTASSTPGQTTTISFSDATAGSDLVIGSGGGAFDVDPVVGFGAATITTVPEPSAFLCLGFIGTGLIIVGSTRSFFRICRRC